MQVSPYCGERERERVCVCVCVYVCIIHVCRARTHKHALSLPRNDTAGTRLLHWREGKTTALFLGGVSSFCLARAFEFLAHFHCVRVLSLCLFVRLFSVSALVFARKWETCGALLVFDKGR